MRDYVLTLLVAAAVTYILTPLARRLAHRAGAIKQPRARDVHVVPIPTLGGLAMYGGLAAGLLVADQIPRLRGGLTNTGMINGLLLAGGLLVVIGFIDDRWSMGALPKAAGQVAAGGILVATGTTLSWLPLPGGNTYIPTTDQATLLTILIVVATINAVNFIDGLDGLAAGIVCIAAVSFFLYYYVLTKVIDISALAAPALASAILIGICLGFLPHNFSPATVFMGDTGSMLLGLLLAYAPISSINSLPEANLTSQINRYPVILPLLLPAALLVIPYGDMLLAVVRRTRAGRSPFAPDRKHLHHRLLDIGHSQRASVLIMYLWAAAFSGSVVWLSIQKTVQQGNSNHHGAPIFVFVIITAVAVAVLLLMSMPRLRWWQRPRLLGASGAGTASAGAGEPALGDPALGSVGPAERHLVGVTPAPAWPGSVPASDLPTDRGRADRGRADRVAAEPPLPEPPLPAPPLPAPPLPAPPVAAAPFTAPPSVAPPSVAPPSATSSSAAPPFAASPLSAQSLDHHRSGWPADQSLRSPWHADHAAGNGAGRAQSLAFWQEAAAGPADGARVTPVRADKRMPSVEPTGQAPPTTARSVIGTPPPAVSGLPAVRRGTHHATQRHPETSPSPAADGSKTDPDALP